MKTALLAAGVLVWTAISIQADVAFTVTPAVITNDFRGQILIASMDAPAGATVQIRKCIDFNGNGQIDPEDFAVGSFSVTDGQESSIGGIRNVNVAGDDDGQVDGNIRIRLLSSGPNDWRNEIAGRSIYQVSDSQNGFIPLTQPFSIRQKIELQGVRGRLTNADGSPATNTLLLLNQRDALGFSQQVRGVITDVTGRYSFYTKPGVYYLTLAGDELLLAASNRVVVVSNQFATANITASDTSLFISGHVTDEQTGEPISGVFMTVRPSHANNGQVHGSFTDADGHYRIPVSSNSWAISPDLRSLAAHGYLGEVSFLTVSNTVTNLNFSLEKGSALIYGRIKNDLGRPVRGLDVYAYNYGDDNNFASFNESIGQSITTNGDYAIAVNPGDWSLYLDTKQFVQRGFWPEWSYSYQDIGFTNLAVRRDILATRINAHIAGAAVDDSGNRIPNLLMYISSSRGDYSVYTDANGQFNFGVVAGSWEIRAAYKTGYLSGTASYRVTSGQKLSVIYTVKKLSAQIVGSVVNEDNTPFTNVYVNATATVNGNEYRASGSTDRYGRFSINVFPGLWTVSPGFISGFKTIPPQMIAVTGTNSMQFIAQPYPVLFGGVLASTGEVLTNVSYTVARKSGSTFYEFYSGVTGFSGKFSVRGEPGEWQFVVKGDSTRGLFETKTNFVVQNDRNVFVHVPHGTNTITGVLRDSDGNPISGIDVSAFAGPFSGDYLGARGTTETDGSYVLRVFDATWQVRPSCNQLFASGHDCSNSQDAIVAGTNVVLDFTVNSRTTHIQGSLMDDSGDPITNVTLTIYRNNSSEQWKFLTDVSGNFDVLATNGTWTVYWDYDGASSNGFFSTSATTVLTNGQGFAAVNLVAKRKTGFVFGSLRDESGEPIANAAIEASVPGTSLYDIQWTDSGGNYSLQLANGNWSVQPSCYDMQYLNYLCTPFQMVTMSNANVQVDFVVQRPAPLQIVTGSLTNGTVGLYYSNVLTAVGGVPPYKWSWSLAQTNNRPPGVVLWPSGGRVLQGIPTAPGTFNFSVNVIDSYEHKTSRIVSLVVQPNPCQYSLSTNFVMFDSEAGTNFVEVIGSNTCVRNIDYYDLRDSWVQFSQSEPDSGPGTVQVMVGSNTSSAPRLAYVSVAGQKLTILQSGTPALDSLKGRTLLISATNRSGLNRSFTIYQEAGFITSSFYDIFDSDGFLETGRFFYNKSAGDESSVGLQRIYSRFDDSSNYCQLILKFRSSSSGIVTNFNYLPQNLDFDIGSFVLADAGLDFDADQNPDLVWQNLDGQLITWSMKGDLVVATNFLPNPRDSRWNAVGVTDMDGDEWPDIFWRNGRGTLAAWLMGGTNYIQARSINGGTPVAERWAFVGANDFDADGIPDFLWQHETGAVALWLMNDYNSESYPLTNGIREVVWLRNNQSDSPWKIVGLADFNGDTQTDLLWQHDDGRLAVWYMIGKTFFKQDFLNPRRASAGWKIVGTADVDQDGQKDLLWMNGSGQMAVWYMEKTNRIGAGLLFNGQTVPPGLRFVGPK